MCASPLPVSEVAATSAAVSTPTASHPRSAICVQDSSRRARVTGASALHIECMQMLQIIVYEDPIPSRLLLNHHSTRTAVPAWRYDSSHLVFTGVTANLGGLPYCNSPFRLSYVPRRKKWRLQQFPLRLRASSRASESTRRQRKKWLLGNAFPLPSRRAWRQWQET
jgi:hypothetical protein